MFTNIWNTLKGECEKPCNANRSDENYYHDEVGASCSHAVARQRYDDESSSSSSGSESPTPKRYRDCSSSSCSSDDTLRNTSSTPEAAAATPTSATPASAPMLELALSSEINAKDGNGDDVRHRSPPKKPREAERSCSRHGRRRSSGRSSVSPRKRQRRHRHSRHRRHSSSNSSPCPRPWCRVVNRCARSRHSPMLLRNRERAHSKDRERRHSARMLGSVQQQQPPPQQHPMPQFFHMPMHVPNEMAFGYPWLAPGGAWGAPLGNAAALPRFPFAFPPPFGMPPPPFGMPMGMMPHPPMPPMPPGYVQQPYLAEAPLYASYMEHFLAMQQQDPHAQAAAAAAAAPPPQQPPTA